MKVIDKIKAAEADNKTLYSFEFYVPKTENGVEALSKCMEKLVSHSPSFCDITWRSTGELTLEIANIMQNFVAVETMMHLTCINMPVDEIDRALDKVKSYGVRNVLALRGDPPRGQDKFVTVDGGFSSALDLVNHMRSKYGDYFGITVAGYPEAHPDVIGANGLVSPEAYASDLAYLKRKVDAGADLIITQLFYDTDVFLKFVNDCRQIGIDCPIVPGIMPIDSYKRFLGSTRLCKTKVPQEIINALEPIKDNDEAVRSYGIHLGTEMCKKILASGIKQLHLYTMNVDKSALAILKNLGLIEESKIQKSLPWKRPQAVNRTEEDGRHINCHSKSHNTQTTVWGQHQHEQGGDNRNASNGALCDHQLTTTSTCDTKLQEKSAVPLQNFEDIHEIFKNALLGKLRKKS